MPVKLCNVDTDFAGKSEYSFKPGVKPDIVSGRVSGSFTHIWALEVQMDDFVSMQKAHACSNVQSDLAAPAPTPVLQTLANDTMIDQK